MKKNPMEIVELKNIVTEIKIHYIGSTSDLRGQKKESVKLKSVEIIQLKNKEENF